MGYAGKGPEDVDPEEVSPEEAVGWEQFAVRELLIPALLSQVNRHVTKQSETRLRHTVELEPHRHSKHSCDQSCQVDSSRRCRHHQLSTRRPPSISAILCRARPFLHPNPQSLESAQPFSVSNMALELDPADLVLGFQRWCRPPVALIAV